MKFRILGLLFVLLSLGSCHSNEGDFDASGVFEATEIVVSAETNGIILKFPFDEGDQIEEGMQVVKIESSALALQKDQIEATIESLSEKKNDPKPQIDILAKQLKAANSVVSTLETQLQVLKKEQSRITNLYQSKAATGQQKDEIDGKVEVLEKQIETAKNNGDVISSQIGSAKKQVDIQNRGITSEKKPLENKIQQVQNTMEKSIIQNPVTGTMLTKYAYEGEFVSVGKALYRIADLSRMELRAYINGDQLSHIAIGQNVKVLIDKDSDSFYEYSGTVSWVSDKAEFTPKSIQTKNERANLVYAIKIRVPNDGKIKIGMYGNILLNDDGSTE